MPDKYPSPYSTSDHNQYAYFYPDNVSARNPRQVSTMWIGISIHRTTYLGTRIVRTSLDEVTNRKSDYSRNIPLITTSIRIERSCKEGETTMKVDVKKIEKVEKKLAELCEEIYLLNTNGRRIIPLHPWLLVRVLPKEHRTESGLFIPGNISNKPVYEAIVLE